MQVSDGPSYRQFAGPQGLASVACVWTGGGGPSRVLPDGCVDVVYAAGRLVVAGPATTVHLSASTGGPPRCGVRFRIGEAGLALGVPAAELLDVTADLSELWGQDARRLRDVVQAAHRPQIALVRGIAERLSPAGDRPARAAVLAIASGATAGEAARAVAMSERQLRRVFERAVGYGPATLVRVLRFQRFLHRAAPAPGAKLARLAAEAGYADQAHLARECRRLSGLSPSELLARGAGPAGEPSLAGEPSPAGEPGPVGGLGPGPAGSFKLSARA